jgi:hypothetical protein
MALQFSILVRNARLDAIEVEMGTLAKLEIREGGVPANCDAGSTGTVLATLDLPSDWMAAAAAGAKAKAGTWEDTSADATGTAAHFRVFASDGTTCGMQGTVGTAATDMIVDSVDFTITQAFTISSFTITDGNA